MSDTKTITFEGRSYTVPVWVEWVARDESGQIWGYSVKPKRVFNGNYFKVGYRRQSILICKGESWRNSLTKV